jgi:hypothetical protein
MKRLVRNEKGDIDIRVLFWCLVLFSIGYGAYKYVPPYVSYYMAKGEIESYVKNAHHYDDTELRRRIVEKTDEWGVPTHDGRLRLTRWDSYMEIELDYSVRLSFFDKYYHTLYFSVNVSEPIKGANNSW